ncbi:MAG: thioredoxin [Candidatus Hodarchaeaceae archaeon]|nr:thioredoxin [Candidatus Hodarchaeaceae archaeon]
MDELDEIRKRGMKELMRKYLGKKEAFGKPIQVTDETFDRVIKAHPVVVVDFWGEWCPPCRLIAPIIEELARDYAGKVIFGKLNVDENKATAVRYGITAIPTLLIFKNGKLVDQVLGAVSKRHLEEKIRKTI